MLISSLQTEDHKLAVIVRRCHACITRVARRLIHMQPLCWHPKSAFGVDAIVRSRFAHLPTVCDGMQHVVAHKATRKHPQMVSSYLLPPLCHCDSLRSANPTARQHRSESVGSARRCKFLLGALLSARAYKDSAWHLSACVLPTDPKLRARVQNTS